MNFVLVFVFLIFILLLSLVFLLLALNQSLALLLMLTQKLRMGKYHPAFPASEWNTEGHCLFVFVTVIDWV